MRGLISAVVVAVAIVLQLAIADRIPFPGGTGPDLVLLTVAALALATGPMAGSVSGFFGGLALDVAPPAGHLVGENALVFCLIGYICGLIATRPSADGMPAAEHSALFEIGVTAAGATCGEAMAAGLGVMLSDPRVTWAAIKHVLPVAIAYDLLLSPFVLLTVAGMLGVAGAVVPRRGTSAAPGPARRAAWTPAPQTGSLRQIGTGNTPRLRLSGAGAAGGASRARAGTGRAALSAGREPRLKLGRGGSLAGGSAFAGTGPKSGGHSGTSKVNFAARRGEGVVGGSGTRVVRAGSRLDASKLASSRLGASLLGGSVFSRPAPRLGRPLAGRTAQSGPRSGRPAMLSGRSLLPGRSVFRSGRGAIGSALRSSTGRAGHLGAGSHQPRFRKPNVLARLARGLRRPDRQKSPGRGWLRGSALSRGPAPLGAKRGLRLRSPGSGWLGRPRSRRIRMGGMGGIGGRNPARLRLRPARPKRRRGGLR